MTCLSSFNDLMKKSKSGTLGMPESIKEATNAWQHKADVAACWAQKHLHPGAPVKTAIKLGEAYQLFRDELKAAGYADRFIPTRDSFSESLDNTGLFESGKKIGTSPIIVFKKEIAGSNLPGAYFNHEPLDEPGSLNLDTQNLEKSLDFIEFSRLAN